MKLKYLTILICCFGYTTPCEIQSECSTCTSFKDAIQTGSSEWTNLKCENKNNKNFTVLRKNSFLNSPNLDTLTIQGLIFDVENGAFNGLDKLQKLELYDNVIARLPNMLFGNLPIENLYIVNNGLKNLRRGIFNGLSKLRVLYIRKNNIRKIQSDLFINLNIKELYLEGNGIELIDDFALLNMENLTKLSLADNSLRKIDIKMVLGTGATKLTKLWLNKNKLTTVTTEMFSLMPNLRNLYLEMNEIKTIEDYAFRGLNNLVVLDISNNKLTDVSCAIGMEHLEFFLLHNNRLTFFNTSGFETSLKLRFLTLFGNPWQCPCYEDLKEWLESKDITQVCDEEFYKGNRPVCVYTNKMNDVCVYDETKNKDLYSKYVKDCAAFPIVPSKCYFAETY